jgi:hypothetical protein
MSPAETRYRYAEPMNYAQQIIRLVRVFVLTFVPLALASVNSAKASLVAGIAAAAEVAWRTVFPVVPGLKARKGTPRDTQL